MKSSRADCRVSVRPRVSRSGFTVTESLVACTLLAVALPTMLTLLVSNRRLMQQTRHQSLILDELTSQTELMVSTEDSSPQPISEPVLRSVPSATIQARYVEKEVGRHLIVTIDWQHHDQTRAQSLTTWVP